MKKEAPLIVEFTNEDVLVAKQALAALTRLRNMSFNPFTEPEKGHQLKEDEITLKKAFELLGIPGEYDSSMLLGRMLIFSFVKRDNAERRLYGYSKSNPQFI